MIGHRKIQRENLIYISASLPLWTILLYSVDSNGTFYKEHTIERNRFTWTPRFINYFIRMAGYIHIC